MKLRNQLRGAALAWATGQDYKHFMALDPKKALKKLEHAFPPLDSNEREQDLRALKYDNTKDPTDFWNDLSDKMNKVHRKMSDTEKAMFAMNAIEGDKDIYLALDIKSPRTLKSVRKKFFSAIRVRDKIRKSQGLDPLRKTKTAKQGAGYSGRKINMATVAESDSEEVNVVAVQSLIPLLKALGHQLPSVTTTAPSSGNMQKPQQDVRRPNDGGNRRQDWSGGSNYQRREPYQDGQSYGNQRSGWNGGQGSQSQARQPSG